MNGNSLSGRCVHQPTLARTDGESQVIIRGAGSMSVEDLSRTATAGTRRGDGRRGAVAARRSFQAAISRFGCLVTLHLVSAPARDSGHRAPASTRRWCATTPARVGPAHRLGDPRLPDAGGVVLRRWSAATNRLRSLSRRRRRSSCRRIRVKAAGSRRPDPAGLLLMRSFLVHPHPIHRDRPQTARSNCPSSDLHEMH